MGQADTRGDSLSAGVAAASVESGIRAGFSINEQRLQDIMDGLSPSVFVGLLTLDGILTYVNRAALEAVGAQLEDVIGKSFDTTPWWSFSDATRERLRAAIRSAAGGTPSRFDASVVGGDGQLLTIDFCLQPVFSRDGEVAYLVPSANDVTERKAAQDRASFLTNHDELTGLPNRILLRERLAQALQLAARQQRRVTVLSVNLDGFKHINDTLGYAGGDELLRMAGIRLTACGQEMDTVARMGSDEFVMVLAGESLDADGPLRAAQRVAAAFAQPFLLSGREIFVTCSIGAATQAHTVADADELLKNASAAMHAAKAQGRNSFHLYAPRPGLRDPGRLPLEAAMRNALKRDEFLLHYQPQVNLKSGKVCGVEALLRWQHPELGMVQPTRLVPIAEETGLIVPIGGWALQAACLQGKAWRDQALELERIGVNLSARQFHQQDLARKVESTLRDTDTDPHLLDLELTESMLMEDIGAAMRTMSELKEIGVHLSLDDFGTGYSSLSYLKHLPIDVLKIDRSFVQEITSDPSSAAIADAIITMAHSLHLPVIAEGVENEGQLAALRALGCDQIQGYLFSKPLAADGLTRLLRDGTTLPN